MTSDLNGRLSGGRVRVGYAAAEASRPDTHSWK